MDIKRRSGIILKSRLLLDAESVIKLHEFSLWNSILNSSNHEICLGSIVVGESKYYDNPQGIKTAIDISNEIANGQVQVLTATSYEINQFYIQLPKPFLRTAQIDEGEAESIAILMRESEEMVFCSNDHGAIMSLTMSGMTHRGVSLQKMLDKYYGIKYKVPWGCSEDHYKKYQKEGQTRKIQYSKLI